MNRVIVTWIDAAMGGDWQDGALPGIPTDAENEVQSIGFLVHKTKAWIVLVQSVAKGHHGNAIDIPAGMVRSISYLKDV